MTIRHPRPPGSATAAAFLALAATAVAAAAAALATPNPATSAAGSPSGMPIRQDDRDRPAPAPPAPPRAPVDADAVARLPHPGTVVPAEFRFSPDGRALRYLMSEDRSLNRVLWTMAIPPDAAEGGEFDPPRVTARPPGGGDREGALSREEELRRERQRQRATGIGAVVHAASADVRVLPLAGDLYLQVGDGPLERLTETPGPELDPKPSPDGTSVAFVRDGDLVSLDVATRREIQLTRGATDGLTRGLAEFNAQEEFDRASGFWWSPDGRRIAYQETDERHIPEFVIAHHVEDPAERETHRYPFAGAENAKVRLGVVPAGGGETLWLNLAPDDSDEEVYLARVDWESPSSLLVQTLNRAQDRIRLYRFHADTGARTPVLDETSEPWYNLHNDLRVVPGTGELVWSSESRGGFRHLELRGRDGSFIRAATSGDWPVDKIVGFDPARREVWFLAGRDDPPRADLFRVGLDGGEPERIDLGVSGVVSNFALAPGGDVFVATVSNLSRPPATRLHARDGKPLTTIADAADDPALERFDLTPPRPLAFESRDGVRLYGLFYPPRSTALARDGKAPLIVTLYGGPHVQYAQDSWAMTADLAARLLAERGFAVWRMDNRGSARRGLKFEAAIHRDMGTIEVADQVDGVRFVADAFPDLVDATRVGVTGGSYGGYMTLRCLTLAPDVFRAGVAVASVTSWDGYDTGYTERYMGAPADNPEGYRRASTLENVENLRGKLLLIHGLLDENVHFRHTARLIARLVEANKPFEFLPLPQGRHGARRVPDRRHVAERTAAFFEAALAP